MPKISVIMPAYNAEKYIEEAIDSILGQTFEDFEFIILNDCSTDRTEEIILSYDDPRIVYLKNEQNLGVAATLNRGLEVAKGKYIARMDADDISLPERFEQQTAVLNKDSQLAAIGSNAIIFKEDGTELYTNVPVGFRNIKITMPMSNPFIHPTMMIRKSMLTGLEYDSVFEGREDYRLWMSLSQRYAMDNLPDRLLKYRHHTNQVTQKHDPSKQYKHFYLKKCYFKELDAGISDDMAEALCTAAYSGHVIDKKQAYDLKAGLLLLASNLCDGAFPVDYERIAYSCAQKTHMGKKELWNFTKEMSLKSRILAML